MISFDYRLLAKRALAVLCLCLLAAAALVPLLRSSTSSCIRQEPGTLDLSGCLFDNSATFKLDGQWAFYWNELPEPEGGGFTFRADPKYMPVPGIWTSSSLPVSYSRYGSATYRLTVLLPDQPASFALKINNIRSASRVYINGDPLGGSGIPGPSKQNTAPRNNPYTVVFSGREGRADLVIHTANYTYESGGIADSVRIGSESAIGALDLRNRTYDILLVAGYLFIGIYFIGQGLQRREDFSSLQLAVYCLMFAVFLLTHSEKLLFTYLPSISYEWFCKLQLISGVLAFNAVSGYTYSLFPALYSRVFRRITQAYTCGLCLIALVFSVSLYARAAGFLLVFSFLSVCYTFYVMAKAAWRKETGSLYLLIGVVAAIMFTLCLAANLFLGKTFYAVPPVAGPIFILAEGLFLSARHAHAYETIRQLSRQLERRDRDKDEFLLKTSNELRTPLDAMINLSLSLYEGAGGPLSASQREDMRLILGTGRRLAFMVRDILDYEQIRKQRITLHRKPVDLQSVAAIVIEVFQFLNKKDTVRIKNHIPPGVYFVYGDEHRLMQIMYNLLDNALKFTDRGSIVFEAKRQGDAAAIAVADTGRGIPKEMLETLFRDGPLMTEDDTPEPIGLGLGLPITRKLVELHEGDIRVDSTPGQGSRFTFTIPLAKDETADAEPEDTRLLLSPVQPPVEAAGEDWKYPRLPAAIGKQERGQAPRILVVDDDYANLKALTNLLILENYAITSVRSGKEALALLEEDRNFDLCIIDVMMPEMSGLELCRQIRTSFSPLDLPVLMATSGQLLHFNESAFRAGANDFIHKPYAWSDLKGRVKTLVQLRRSVSDRLSSEIAMLRAQIKPHFLYNAINTIIWMSSRDNEKTRQLLYDLSHFLRGSFDFSNQETAIPFEKELELVEAYLSLEQARFGKRLKARYDLEITGFALPPLIVQPIVENAVRHGLMEKIGGGSVVISTRREEKLIRITVADDGKGMSDEQLATWMNEGGGSGQRTGIGLQNINRRLLTQFGRPLVLSRRPGGGIEVHITIPWKGEGT